MSAKVGESGLWAVSRTPHLDPRSMPLEGMSNSALDSKLQVVRLISLGDSKQSTGELSFQLEKCSFYTHTYIYMYG